MGSLIGVDVKKQEFLIASVELGRKSKSLNLRKSSFPSASFSVIIDRARQPAQFSKTI